MATPSGNGFNRFSGRSLMTGSSFQYAPDQDGSKQGNWMLWGQGVRSDFYGRPQAELGLDGRVGAAYMGADRRWGSKVVVGVAASHSVGSLDYANGGDGENELQVGARLTGAHPYLKWSPRPGLDLWGLMGYGRGAAEVDVAGESVEMGIDIRMAALGGRSELTRVGAVDLALKADAFAVSVGSEAVEELRVADGDTQRTRLMLEGRTDWSLSSHSTLTPSLEVGARMDGGDAETGLGAELAGGASFANRRLGLVVEARGHWLMAHQDRNFKERGARLAVRLDPGADGKGWGLSLAPLWGNSVRRRRHAVEKRADVGGKEPLGPAPGSPLATQPHPGGPQLRDGDLGWARAAGALCQDGAGSGGSPPGRRPADECFRYFQGGVRKGARRSEAGAVRRLPTSPPAPVCRFGCRTGGVLRLPIRHRLYSELLSAGSANLLAPILLGRFRFRLSPQAVALNPAKQGP